MTENSDEDTRKDLILPPGIDLDLTEEDKKFIEMMRLRRRMGPPAAPLLCIPECTLKESCEYFLLNKLPPKGTPCPLEMVDSDDWFHNYAQSLQLEEDDYVSAVMLREVVNWMVLENRYFHEFRRDPKAAGKTFRGVDKSGSPIFDIKPNPVLKSLKEASMRKQAIFKALVATKLEKAKLNTVERDEPSVAAAKLQRSLERLNEQTEKKNKLIAARGGLNNGEITEAEFTVRETKVQADVPTPSGDKKVRGTDASDGESV